MMMPQNGTGSSDQSGHLASSPSQSALVDNSYQAKPSSSTSSLFLFFISFEAWHIIHSTDSSYSFFYYWYIFAFTWCSPTTTTTNWSQSPGRNSLDFFLLLLLLLILLFFFHGSSSKVTSIFAIIIPALSVTRLVYIESTFFFYIFSLGITCTNCVTWIVLFITPIIRRVCKQNCCCCWIRQ